MKNNIFCYFAVLLFFEKFTPFYLNIVWNDAMNTLDFLLLFQEGNNAYI